MINHYYKIKDKYHKKIALLSDIHYSKHYDETIFYKIIQNLKQHEPNYICVAGDIIDDSKTLDDEVLKNRLIDFFKKLSLISPVFFIIGNHDMTEFKNNEAYYKYNRDFFSSLNKLPNITFLENNSETIDDINFIGMNTNFEYYQKTKEKTVDALNNDFKNLEKYIKKGKYNILLFHSPINILKVDNIEKIDLVLSGHMHNGLVFKFLDKKGNRGLVGPFINFFPVLARGMKKDKTTLIISSGIIKLSYHTKISKFNKLYDMHIEYIDI